VNRSAEVSTLIDGLFIERASLERLLWSLRFDEGLNGKNPSRSTLDFRHAIQIVEMTIAAICLLGDTA
jgi:hypothetical protein